MDRGGPPHRYVVPFPILHTGHSLGRSTGFPSRTYLRGIPAAGLRGSLSKNFGGPVQHWTPQRIKTSHHRGAEVGRRFVAAYQTSHHRGGGGGGQALCRCVLNFPQQRGGRGAGALSRRIKLPTTEGGEGGQALCRGVSNFPP
jgi:hypothetical protein